ncbi:MAG: hypothetical protein KDC34_12670, partial [Saprospiraceae bacterium]|nr:hypothetical protein [Saprospiraceae bacterium]
MVQTLISLFFLQLFQTGNPVPEKLYAQVSQPFYTGGDIIWSKVYFLDTDSSEIQSRVVYVELLDPSGKLIHQERIQRMENYANWSYQLPFDLPGGIYVLRFFTLWNLNFEPPQVYDYPFELLVGNGTGSAPPDYSKWENNRMVVGPLPVQINLQPEKDVYQKGETIRVYLEASADMGSPVQGNFSAAVTDAAWIPPIYATRPNFQTCLNRYEKTASIYQARFSPETGLRVEGKAYQTEDGTLLETNYLSLHLVEHNNYLQEPTEDGAFVFDLPAFYGTQNAQIHNLNPYQSPLPKVEIIEAADYLNFDPNIQLEAAIVDSTARNRYLFLMRKQRKFRELFNQAPTEIRELPKQKIAFGTPSKTYDMADFEQLISVEEFLNEVVLTARLKGKEGDRKVFLQSSDDYRRYSQSAWFQVDGFLISDASYAMNIPFGSVKSIEIYSDKERIVAHFPSILAAFGVIGIKTREGTLPAGLQDVSNRFNVMGYHFPYEFQDPP